MINLCETIQLDENFGKVTCERAWKWDTRKQPLSDFDLWYAWGGEGRMCVNDETFSICKGTCFLFRPGDRTLAGHNPQKPLTVTFLHFTLPSDETAPFQSYRIVRDTFLFETYLNRFVETMIFKGSNYDTEARLLLALMLLQLLREQELDRDVSNSSKEQDHLTTVIQTIAYRVRQFPSGAHTLESLAASAQLSPRYFSLKFKKVMGITVEQYIIQLKMERAEHLLRYNGMNVSEVAEALGFTNLPFFSRQFKQVRGRTPSHLKKKGAST